MDQRLAVEAQLAALDAFALQPLDIREIVVDAVEDVDAEGMGGEHALGEPRQHRGAAGKKLGAGFLGMSLVPMTKPASRVSGSATLAAMAGALMIPIGVSIIAHTLIF